MKKVLIIDYGMGNLGSARRAFEECGAEVVVSSDPNALEGVTHVVLPGVGAFGDGAANLKANGWFGPLRDVVGARKIPFLGICLGMQLIADRGFEGSENEGIGLIPGEVVKLVPKQSQERIPHIGWNEITPKADCPLFTGLPAGTDVYFVHSYHFVCKDPSHVAAVTPYCGTFASAVARDNIYGVQFHPEKSAKAGFHIIRNFLGLV